MAPQWFISHLCVQTEGTSESVNNRFKTEKGEDRHWKVLTSELFAGGVSESKT